MKHSLLISLFVCFFAISYAQTSDFAKDFSNTVEILRDNRPYEAFSYWLGKESLYRTDSLYAYACANLGMGFLEFNHIKSAEILTEKAWNAINSYKSVDSWFWKNKGYVAARMALLNIYKHDYIKARDYAVDAKIAYEHSLHRGAEYATIMSLLADIALRVNDPVLARIFAGQALLYAFMIDNKSNNDDSLNDLCVVLMQAANIEARLGYYKEAIKVYEELKNYSLQDGNFIMDLYLGAAYVSNANYDKAEKCLSPCYEQFENMTFKIESGVNLLMSKYKLGHKDIYELAYNLAKLQEDNIGRMFSFMSYQEKEKWWMSYENAIIPLVNQILLKSNLKNINGIIANNTILTKGLLLRSSNTLKKKALSSDNRVMIEKFYSLEALKSKWANSVKREVQVHLEEQISALERDLQLKLDININDVPSWKKVSSSLLHKEVAIEFVRYESLDNSNEAEYYAIIVRKGCKEPLVIHVCNESLLKSILDNTVNRPVYSYVADLYSIGLQQCNGQKLYDLVWAKIEKEIEGCTTVYYSPSGLLNTLSFIALYNGESYLGDKYMMQLVSSIGVIPNMKRVSSSVCQKAVIYGDIQYDLEESRMIQSSLSDPNVLPVFCSVDVGETRTGWKKLPGTKKEVMSIGSMFIERGIDVKLITGINAHEKSFKNLTRKGVDILHIATHGFFLSDKNNIKKNAFLNPSLSDNIGNVDPMLRSGLLLAGANRVWTGKRNNIGVEDGILTAKEISTLDLSNLDLVVLSACQTGLGDINASEGVYGLQRAFKLAGANTIIMSLWEVDDRATSIMMESFYEKYLSGQSKREAFIGAVNAVRAYEYDGEKIFDEPYYWGGFVMMD